MPARYNKLFKLLIDRNMAKKKLSQASGVSSTTLAKLVKGESVTTDVLVKICEALNCDFSDIMEMEHISKNTTDSNYTDV